MDAAASAASAAFESRVYLWPARAAFDEPGLLRVACRAARPLEPHELEALFFGSNATLSASDSPNGACDASVFDDAARLARGRERALQRDVSFERSRSSRRAVALRDTLEERW